MASAAARGKGTKSLLSTGKGEPAEGRVEGEGRRAEGSSIPLVSSRSPPYLFPVTETTDIYLSSSAAARVAAIAERQGKPPILRLSVEGGGCAGFQYRFGLADEIEAGDLAVAQDGVTLVVDPVSLDLVRGATVDFVESLGGAAFQVGNPNAASGCGCGTSFSV
jgi:iron-sulfur cluster insertion protein